MKDLDAAHVRELLLYDAEAGTFRWSDSPKNGRKAGRAVGTVSGNGYVMIRLLGRPRLAHRLAWLVTHGRLPEYAIDHVNGVRHDNRIANLRDVPAVANAANSPRKRLLICAVMNDAGRWDAYAVEFGERVLVGTYDTPEEANRAAKKAQAARTMWGRRPRLRMEAVTQ